MQMITKAALILTATVAVILAAVGIVAGCGGPEIPDDVEWDVVGGWVAGMEPDPPGGGNYRVRLNKSVSEEVLRAVGKDVKRQHINVCRDTNRPQCERWYPELSTVGVWFYLPGMNTEDVAWGRAFFLPDEEQIEIIGNLQSTPTSTATPTLIAPPTPTVATAQDVPTASRQEVYEALDSLNLGLLPLDRHGMDDWWSTRLPNGGITSIDIFGHADRVETVEMWFTPRVHPTALLVVEALVATIVPEQEAQSMSWFRDSLESIEQTGEQKQQTSAEAMYLTLQWVPNVNQYFFSIDEERR